MNSPFACPRPDVLQRFALRLLDAALHQQVADHLSMCEPCRQALRQTAAIATLPDQPATPTGSVGAASKTPVTEADRLAETRLFAEEGAEADDELELSFLEPSADQQSLGRIGKYEVRRILGRGGMGVVFEAFDAALHRTVALKVMAPELATSAKARRRFVREARAAAAINHPNVVIIHAVDEQNGMPYLVMEYVAGCSLRDRIRRTPRLEPVDILRIAAQIAAGLAAAHEQGVIHRDIKPSNILLEDGVERVKIADFGLARAAMDLSDITTRGHGVGTPAYVAPEQVTGGATDQRSDLFSLGCVIYAMAVGHSPFRGRLALEVIRQVADHHPRPLAERDERISPAISDIVAKLLQKEPRNRYQGAREAADALNEQLFSYNQMASDRLPRAPVTRRRPARRKAILVKAALVLAVVAAGTAWFAAALRSTSDEPADAGVESAPSAIAARNAAPGASPADRAVITVSRSGQADFQSLQEALSHARPQTVVRILDDAVYDGPLVLNDAERLRGVRIESPRHAALQDTSSKRPVVTVSNTPGVVIDGPRLEASQQQHALWIGGDVPGVRVENVDISHAPGATCASVVIDRAVGAAEAPLTLRGCTIDDDYLAMGVFGGADSPTAWLRVEQCRFRLPGTGVALSMEIMVTQAAVERCVFTGGGDGAGVHLGKGSQDVAIVNNTFFRMSDWVAIDARAVHPDVSVRRNLVLESRLMLHEQQELQHVVDQCLSENWWEQSAGSMENQVAAVCAPRPPSASLPVSSRDPASRDFLRPLSDSPLARQPTEKGLDYIGALPPADGTTAAADSSTTLEKAP